MKILGVELASNKLNYVLLVYQGDAVEIAQANRLQLTSTRSPDALRAFQSAVSALLTGANPDRIGIKSKPESGQMRAGAAALKMEAILLAAAPCPVEFVSGARIVACEDCDGLKKYHQPACKAASVIARKA